MNNVSVPHPVPVVSSSKVIVTCSHESITVIKSVFGAGISSIHSNVPPLAGGHVTTNEQQFVGATKVTLAVSVQADASVTVTIYVPGGRLIAVCVVCAGIVFHT